jgi:hypothetical protein
MAVSTYGRCAWLANHAPGGRAAVAIGFICRPSIDRAAPLVAIVTSSITQARGPFMITSSS